MFEDEDAPVPFIDTIDRWDHQIYARHRVRELIEAGCKRILVASPTGGGKSMMIYDCARDILAKTEGVTLFANRKLLIDQIIRSLNTYGISHGVRAAQHFRSGLEMFQVASIQTEHSRVCKRKIWEPHPSGLFIVDEAHMMENPRSHAVYSEYIAAGAVKLGFTATPLGLSDAYDELVVAGVNSELRKCGALVPAVHFGCTEPDMRNIGRFVVGEDYTEDEQKKLIMVPGIHGRVIDWYRRLNPHGLPALGFAPGVPESVGFAQAFHAAGISAAHIDGDTIWINGNEVNSTETTRNELLEMSRTGQVRIVWNRFVLREAIDMPWLRHGILATVFGSLQSYLQSGGRLLRSCLPVGKREVVVQDHGGNWWRHGSLNSDRNWRLSDTSKSLANERADALGGDTENPPKEQEPLLCMQCGVALHIERQARIIRCHRCGHEFEFHKRSRPVLQADGELIEYHGVIHKPKRVERRPDTFEKWKQEYWRAYRSGTMTFAQARGYFFYQHGYYPPKNLPLMPMTEQEWFYVVKKVPQSRLRDEQ